MLVLVVWVGVVSNPVLGLGFLLIVKSMSRRPLGAQIAHWCRDTATVFRGRSVVALATAVEGGHLTQAGWLPAPSRGTVADLGVLVLWQPLAAKAW